VCEAPHAGDAADPEFQARLEDRRGPALVRLAHEGAGIADPRVPIDVGADGRIEDHLQLRSIVLPQQRQIAEGSGGQRPGRGRGRWLFRSAQRDQQRHRNLATSADRVQSLFDSLHELQSADRRHGGSGDELVVGRTRAKGEGVGDLLTKATVPLRLGGRIDEMHVHELDGLAVSEGGRDALPRVRVERG
jgi:hypothetical protein